MPYKDPNSDVAKASRKRCLERSRAKRRAWTKANPKRVSVPMEVQRKNREKYYVGWTTTETGKKSTESASLKWRTGLTPEEVERLIIAQNSLCALCKSPLDLSKPYLKEHSPTIDHKHDEKCCKGTRSCAKCRRGIVHRNCKSGLGMFEDDPVKLRLAAEYLEKYLVN